MGPDGAEWFTEPNTNKIGRIRKDGALTEFKVPTANSYPYGIVAGADGAMWFTENAVGKVGRIPVSGSKAVTEYAFGTTPGGIVVGSDGALWAADSPCIDRITTAGQYTCYEFPWTGDPDAIASGPDGALWFTDPFAGRVGRLTTSGQFSYFNAGTPNTTSVGITAGPDGAIWVAFQFNDAGKIGRFTMSGSVSWFYPTQRPAQIAFGADGALWFPIPNSLTIGRMTTSGQISTISFKGLANEPFGIGPGPNGSLWFTDEVGSRVFSFRP